MLLVAVMQILLWTTPAFALLSLTASPVFTTESLNGTAIEEPKQTFTVPLDLDLEAIETDPVTDGGTEVNSQSAMTSTVTPVLSNVTDGGENNIKLQELSTTSIDLKQPITLDVFNLSSTEGPASGIGSASKETGDNSTLIPLLDPNKAYPSDEQLQSFLEIPVENSTEGKECFCNIPGPVGQKGDKGDTGDPGEPGKAGKRGPQGLEGVKGKKGLPGSKGDTGLKGDKGDVGLIGPKGEQGTSCAVCEIVEKGEQGSPGKDGAKGEPGIKGTKGENGINGINGAPGEAGTKGAMGPRGPAGPKGDQGMLGAMGPPGYRGPAGIPGRKGDKGQKGAQSDHENIAFSVGVRGQRNIFLPGRPIRFDKVFVNENKPYSVNSGIFVANIEGVYFFTYHISLSHPLMIGLAHNGKIVVQTQARQCEHNVCQASGSVLLHLREDDEIWLQVLTSAQKELISDESDSLFTGFILYSLED